MCCASHYVFAVLCLVCKLDSGHMWCLLSCVRYVVWCCVMSCCTDQPRIRPAAKSRKAVAFRTPVRCTTFVFTLFHHSLTFCRGGVPGRGRVAACFLTGRPRRVGSCRGRGPIRAAHRRRRQVLRGDVVRVLERVDHILLLARILQPRLSVRVDAPLREVVCASAGCESACVSRAVYRIAGGICICVCVYI